MSSCTRCGHESASTARFCSECGLPLVSPEATGAEVVGGTDKSNWLTSPTSSEERAVRNTGVRRGTKHPGAVVAVGLILAIVAWNLFRAPTTQIEGLSGDLDVVSPSAPTTTSTVVTADGAAGADDTANADRTSTSAASETDTASVDVDVDVDVADLDPDLSRYHLFAHGSGRLLRVDLADGQSSLHEVPGRLLGAFDGRLIFVEPDATITSLPLDDLDADPMPLTDPAEPGHDLIAATLTTDGLVHLTTGIFSSPRPDLTMMRIDLLTGSQQISQLDRYGSFGLVEVPGAGLFEFTGDGFRPLTDGSVRFYGERYLIVENCDAPARCFRFWFDRVTRSEVDRPVPEQSSGVLLGRGGRIAMSFDVRGRVFIDTQTGEMLPDMDGFDGDVGLVVPDAVTPDERFLAARRTADSREVQIHDVENGVTWTIELDSVTRLAKVLLVAKPDGG